MPDDPAADDQKALIEAATRAANKLLKALDEPLIVVVDDQAVPTEATFVAAYSGNRRRATQLLPDETAWDELDETEWRNAVSAAFRNQLSPDQRRDLHAAALKRLDALPTFDLDVLQTILGVDNTLLLLPDEWNERQEELLFQHDGASKLLVLFDRNLGEGRPNGGVELLSAYLQKHDDGRAAILTHEIDPGEELAERDRIVEDPELRPRTLIAAKGNLTPAGGQSFLNTIRLTANAPLLLEVRRRLLDHVSDTFEVASDKLLAIQPQVLEDIAFRTSRAEGEWELNTLLRLVAVLQDKAAREALKPAPGEHPSMLPLIEKARRLVQAMYVEHEPSVEHGRELMAWERWHEGEHVNPIGLPLANGDVFKIQDQLYVLLCQPCDIAIRSTGKRRSEHTLTLLPLEPQTEDEMPSKNRTVHKLPPGFPPRTAGLEVRFGQWLDIDAAVLDLCTFRTDGSAIYTPDAPAETLPSPLTEGIAARRAAVIKLMRKRLQHVEAIAQVPSATREQIAKALLRADAAHKVGHAHDQQSLSYDLQRVARLNPIYAEAALAAFAAERSRQAHDFDLDRFVA